jgi:hypothetical protein
VAEKIKHTYSLKCWKKASARQQWNEVNWVGWNETACSICIEVLAFLMYFFDIKNFVAWEMQMPSCEMELRLALRNGMDALLLLCGAQRLLK